MNKTTLLLICFTSLAFSVLLPSHTLTAVIMAALVLLYSVGQKSLVNLMILLELMILMLFFSYFSLAANSGFESWNIFYILVFSVAEASIGLSLLVYFSRAWGEMLKISKFMWLCSLIKP